MSTRSQESQPLRILLTIHHDLEFNAGAPGSTLRMADSLRALGHAVSVVGFEALQRPWHPQFLPLLFPFRMGADVARVLHRHEVDVVEASTGDLWTLPRPFIARSFGVLITRSHGLEHLAHHQNVEAARQGDLALRRRYFVYHGGIRLRQVARSLQIADAALFMNPHERQWAIDHLAISAERSSVIRNGISGELLGLPAPGPSSKVDRIRIAVLGGFLERKGAPTAAAVLSRLLRDNLDWGASWFGAEPESVRSVLDPGVSERVNILSRYDQTEIPRLLAGHQILLFLSHFEGFPLAPLEAMACGLAVVASDIPGPSDIIRAAGGGVLVPSGDVDVIAEAVIRLVADRYNLDLIRAQAHESAQRFAWADIASERETLYRVLLDKKRRESLQL